MAALEVLVTVGPNDSICVENKLIVMKIAWFRVYYSYTHSTRVILEEIKV